jgi:probable F420-dependent oxidoreductase
VWLSDRVVTTQPLAPVYPFTDDGHAPWTDDTPFLEAVTVMAMVAATTRTVEIGVGVLVLPLRSPVLLAKQLATVDALSGGRIALGIGAGWMAEEYAALGIPFAERGTRTDEAIALLRACWTGTPGSVDGRHYQLPAGVRMNPRPSRQIPILAGGMTQAALRRASRVDGWFGYLYADRLEISEVRDAMRVVGNGRRGVLRLVGSADQAARFAAELAAAGITEVIVDIDWRASDASEQVERVRDAAARAPSAVS